VAKDFDVVRILPAGSRPGATTAPTLLTSPRFIRLGLGTLLLTAAGWVDVLASGAPAPLAALVGVALLASGVWQLARAVLLQQEAAGSSEEKPARRLGRLTLYAALAISSAITLALVVALVLGSSGTIRLYDSDAAAFNHYNADLVVHGRSPYVADADFWDALRRFPSVGATPLRAGRYAASQLGPSLGQVVADAHSEATTPSERGPEFAPASLHSYPALSFLVFVPGVWAGLPTTFWTSLLFLIAFLTAAFWRAPRRLWLPLGVVALANSLLAFWTLRGSFEEIALLPALLAWRTLDRRMLSPALLGIACAVKQVVWPLAPLYLVVIWRQEGPRAALLRIPIVALGFLIPNLPFALASPTAWASSLLLPVTLPIFPSGVGLISLVRAGILPLWQPWVYSVLVLIALAALVIWIARSRVVPPAGVVLVVGLMPLAFAWHSLFAYFMALPVLAIAAALPLLQGETAAPIGERAPEPAAAG
jgi:hypothetical protein